MSIDIYKELNKDIIDKMQDLKKDNAFLENEVVLLNAKYFEEHQLRIEEKHKLLSVVNHIESEIMYVKRYLLAEDIGSQCLINETRDSRRRITCSSGVTRRSPVKCRSSEVEVNNSKPNTWGFSNIEEVSANTEATAVNGDGSKSLNGNTNTLSVVLDNSIPSHSGSLNDLQRASIASPNQTKLTNFNDDHEKTLLALSRLNIKEKNEQNGKSLSLKDKSQYDNTTIQVLSSDESQGNTENTIDVPRNPSKLKGGKRASNRLQHASITAPNVESLLNFETNTFNLNAVHSTPIFKKTSDDETTAASTVSRDSNDSDLSNTSTRPRRRCAPTSLVEPNVGSKLRNENCKKKKPEKKNKRK